MTDFIKVYSVGYGIASRVGDSIYLNKALHEFPRLRDAILEHEYEHTSSQTISDLILDIDISQLRNLKGLYWKFILTHPSSWSEFIPIWKYNGKWTFNPVLFGFYLLVSGICGVALWILI